MYSEQNVYSCFALNLYFDFTRFTFVDQRPASQQERVVANQILHYPTKITLNRLQCERNSYWNNLNIIDQSSGEFNFKFYSQLRWFRVDLDPQNNFQGRRHFGMQVFPTRPRTMQEYYPESIIRQMAIVLGISRIV